MTPQATVGAVVAGAWAVWAGARVAVLPVRRGRRRVAQAVAVGRPSIRNEFPREVRHEILHGPLLGWRRRCRKCWVRPAREADHLVSSERGGSNDAGNGAPLCRSCNRGKGAGHELWAVARWVTPWVGWSFPIPTPVMLAAAIVVVAVLTRGQM